MSRHRNIRSINYSDECENYDEVYGHSVEDDYSISPSAEQFMYDRTKQSKMSAFFREEAGIAEEDEDSFDHDEPSPKRPQLSDMDEAKLQSCMDQIRSVVGDAAPESAIIDAVMRSAFDFQKALDFILHSNSDNVAAANKTTDKQREIVSGEPLKGELKPLSAQPVKISQTKSVNVTKGFHVATDHQQTNIASPMELSPRSVSPANCENIESQSKMEQEDYIKFEEKAPLPAKVALTRYETERSGSKPVLHMVIIGHVDAGKSTLMGHLLHDLGQVNQRVMHKYEQESKKIGKQSFMYAWILDETGEERSRGITMDVGHSRFETPNKKVVLLDAPGHRDFIPNMISGATQADCAVLVVDAGKSAFESGFESGGQTREHALLVRSLGVSQLAVAINKLDTVSWDQTRFLEIANKLGLFLRQAGFRDSDVTFVPCSGLSGQNLVSAPTEEAFSRWYHGPCLLEVIDKFKIPERLVSRPFRLSVNDIFKSAGTGFCVLGKVDTGTLQTGDRVLIQPQGEQAVVKGITIDDLPSEFAFAGDEVCLTLQGIDMQNVNLGYVLCHPAHSVPVSSKVEARIVLFDIQVPITQGFPVMVHIQSLLEQAVITKLVAQLHRSSGEVIKRRPRCLPKNTGALIEITFSRPICVELYRDVKELGRFMLRSSGVTIAAGLITKIF